MERWFRTTEEYHCCVSYQKSLKNVCSHVFPFFQLQIYHLQDGFVSGRSCVTSLLRSTHAFAKALDERKQVDTVFLDYSKAFDSVSFNCLLKELFDVGVRGNLLSWFRSYLRDCLSKIHPLKFA